MPGPGPAEAVGSAEEEEEDSAAVAVEGSAVVGVMVEVAEVTSTLPWLFSWSDSTWPFGSTVHTSSPNRNPNHRLGSVPKSAEMIIGRTSSG